MKPTPQTLREKVAKIIDTNMWDANPPITSDEVVNRILSLFRQEIELVKPKERGGWSMERLEEWKRGVSDYHDALMKRIDEVG